MISPLNHQQLLSGSREQLSSCMAKTYLFSTSSDSRAISINSLDITLLKPVIDFAKYEYLILTSKRAVKALENYPKSEYIDKKALCVSAQTAQSYRELGGEILEVGSGYGDNLVAKIKNYPKKTQWLYLRAQEIASDFVQICKSDGYNIDESVVYRSSCSKEILSCSVESGSNLIFTSPSSVRCYLKMHKLQDFLQIVVIGKTTAKALPKGINYTIAKEKTIMSCLEIIKQKDLGEA